MLPQFPTPYYAVIFTSIRTEIDDNYSTTNDTLEQLAKEIDGYLGIESVRNEDGLGISVSYWKSLESIDTWRKHTQHKMAKEEGINDWYKNYSVRISKVEKDTFFSKKD
jgi:heme-degrading monooxygenase HmoA